MGDLEPLGGFNRCAQHDRQIVGHVASAEGDDSGMANAAFVKKGDVAGAAADVNQDHAELFLILTEHRIAGGERLQHQAGRGIARLFNAAVNVLGGGNRPGDDVDFSFEAHTGHADGIADAALVVDDELLRQDMDHLAVERQRHSAGRFDDPADILFADLIVLAGDSHHAASIDAADMVARDAGVNHIDLDVGHLLSLLHRRTDRTHGLFRVDDDAIAKPFRRRRPDTDDLDLLGFIYLGNETTDLGSADVEPGNDIDCIHTFILTNGFGS